VHLNLHRKGLGSIVRVTPIAIETSIPSWWNDCSHVKSYHGFHAPFTVHGRVRPIIGNGGCGRGPRSSQPLPRALRVPQTRLKYVGGSGAPVLTSQGSDEAEIVP
jgi:hypothetical protein